MHIRSVAVCGAGTDVGGVRCAVRAAGDLAFHLDQRARFTVEEARYVGPAYPNPLNAFTDSRQPSLTLTLTLYLDAHTATLRRGRYWACSTFTRMGSCTGGPNPNPNTNPNTNPNPNFNPKLYSSSSIAQPASTPTLSSQNGVVCR